MNTKKNEINKNPSNDLIDELNQQIKDETLNDFISDSISEKINKTNMIKNSKTKKSDKFKIAILCGGPSSERGVSLNSARSVLDHLRDDTIELIVFFIDSDKKAHLISDAQLYSNTPSDFDFKLQQTSICLSELEFIDELKKVNITFPLIHGKYGEDGEIQSLLEQNNITYIGSKASSCRRAFNKQKSAEIMFENGFYAFPSIVVKEFNNAEKIKVQRFFDLNKLKKAIVKPTAGGSSIGVHCVYSANEAIEKIELLFRQNYNPVILEPFCVGKEFTIIVLQNIETGKPVSLIPTEIEMKYDHYQIFDYRRKYLPTEQTRYHNPARFADETIERIRKYSEELFLLLELNDIVRIDGWLLNDGRIWFSDINIASGMEQNSFVFQQSSRIGLSHYDFLHYIIKSSCARQKINFPNIKEKSVKKENVHILFGGDNAERQVSLMSGSNVWLKLRKSTKYEVKPFLLDKEGNVWYLPYMYNLSHTVEEIYDNCISVTSNIEKLKKFLRIVSKELNINEFIPELPKKYTMDEFLKFTKDVNAFLFLALHGGKGEDGSIQKKLETNNISYNGSSSKSSKLCMDKYKTSEVISNLNDENILVAPKIQFFLHDFKDWTASQYEEFWEKTKNKLNFSNFIIKPCCDGSSAGAVRIYDFMELKVYINFLNQKAPYIPKDTFKNQPSIIEMPSNIEQSFLLEAFIETDKISLENSKIQIERKLGWLELTVGVIEDKGKYHSLNPSITVAENNILTIEEKFQGGTGINITPPPSELIDNISLEQIKLNIEKVSRALQINNYARIDIFFNTITKKMIVIEANTLPALTPSTVIYHQALSENPSIYPVDFLELIIKLAK